MIEDRKKFMMKKGSKEVEVEVVGFDPDKVDTKQYQSQAG